MNLQIAIVGLDPTFLVQTIFDIYRFSAVKDLSKTAVIFWPKSSMEKLLNSDSFIDNPEISKQSQVEFDSDNFDHHFDQENQLLAQEYLSKIDLIQKIEDQILEIFPEELHSGKKLEADHRSKNQLNQSWQSETIKTDNLVLKELSLSHLDLIWQAWSDKVGHLLTQTYATKDELAANLSEKISQNKQKTRLDWAIMDREDGDFLGLMGVQFQENDLVMDFWLKESVWQQGFGSQAVLATLSWLQKNLAFKSLILTIEKNNVAASKIVNNLGAQVQSEFSILKSDTILTFTQYQLKNNVNQETKTPSLEPELSTESGLGGNYPAKVFIKTTKSQFECEKVIMGKAFWQSLAPEIREKLKNSSRILIKNNENTEISDFMKN